MTNVWCTVCIEKWRRYYTFAAFKYALGGVLIGNYIEKCRCYYIYHI